MGRTQFPIIFSTASIWFPHLWQLLWEINERTICKIDGWWAPQVMGCISAECPSSQPRWWLTNNGIKKMVKTSQPLACSLFIILDIFIISITQHWKLKSNLIHYNFLSSEMYLPYHPLRCSLKQCRCDDVC